MLFLYLEKVSGRSDLPALYQEECVRSSKTDDAIARASKILSDVNIEHAFFKTIRPYRYTTVDLDILIFESTDYKKSVGLMQMAGYRLAAYGPMTATLFDLDADIGIDLYREVAVSLIPYIDKQTLAGYVTTTELPNGEHVKTLEPEADLACLIAHSVIKEQMYTLSEYYTFINYLKKMNTDHFVHLARQNNITSAARTHASITALLHKIAHGTLPEELQRILNSLGAEDLDTRRLIEKNFETPYRYHPITIAKSLIEVAKGEKARKSIPIQLLHMFNPSFSKDFLRLFIEHLLRETY